MKKLLLYCLLPLSTFAQQFSVQEIAGYKAQSKQVTIIRDTWGIPHVYGKTDADAVFGLMYAQCEDDFRRVENNYLEMFGRLSESDGEGSLYDDLQMQLIYDTTQAKNDYKKSAPWFQKLMNSFAAGMNYYLAKHPAIKPVITRYEPWFALMRTDGSIAATQTGGLTTQDMKSLYSRNNFPPTAMLKKVQHADDNQSGSNGFAVAPAKTASGNAILYINPHVTFYFRPEVHMVSEEGLNAYGAVTWGQFFVYQGFNEHCGWMHTSSVADVSDLYEEKIIKKGDSLFYEYDNALRPVGTRQLVLKYRKDEKLVELPVTAYYTHHGPVVGSRDNKWLSLKENNRSSDALMQSWLRTKAKGFADFEKTMQLKANNSNNTVFADDKGNIAYWHGNFMPVRDPAFDWNKPVDGTTPATEWKGVHNLNDIVHVYNPASGFIQNCNSTPFTVSGPSSPDRNKYPAYMAPDAENFRGINAVRLLSSANKLTTDKMIRLGYDQFLAAFDVLLPPLLKAYQSAPDSFRQTLGEPVKMLENWDRRCGLFSIATTLAVEWGNKMLSKYRTSRSVEDMTRMSQVASPGNQLSLLAEVVTELTQKFGTWKVAWGEVNRFQRLTGQLNQVYDDHKPSLPAGMVSSTWGCLPSFDGRRFPGTNKRYGIGGNSFVAAIEFGKTVKAKSVLAGGENSSPQSKHFTDQAPLYLEGNFKEVWFYRTDVLKHVERRYYPGE